MRPMQPLVSTLPPVTNDDVDDDNSVFFLLPCLAAACPLSILPKKDLMTR
jgi:hypothetical protein